MGFPLFFLAGSLAHRERGHTNRKVGKVSRDKSPILSGNVSLVPGNPTPESNPIIQVNFRANQFSASGIRVESLSLHNEKYKPYKGVKNVTLAGRFQIRT